MSTMEENPQSPGVLIFPFPIEGHLNSMLNLAKLLAQTGLNITFLNSHHNHTRLLLTLIVIPVLCSISDSSSRPTLMVSKRITPEQGDRVTEIFNGLTLIARIFMKELLIATRPSVSCIKEMEYWGFFAMALKIPLIPFRNASAYSFWAFFIINAN
ncbi:hypothetical protein Pint_06408 [Pistacia integerrima]|uniref:Uncharacterized protein n=1 Tax=Pistacia integerrima TaxID=434235 RepID=A0ACC0ZBJ3_9ROSI|nr:hypothetical protein Pint_06408 [Pistacia integerrima]